MASHNIGSSIPMHKIKGNIILYIPNLLKAHNDLFASDPKISKEKKKITIKSGV